MKPFNINSSTGSEVAESFNKIANELITNSKLVINNKMFSFIDLEFYYYCPNHPDEYTLPHSRPMGEFEMHRFGIDISLGNGQTEFGGILLRGLYDEAERKTIIKSHILKTLLNNLFLGENFIQIISEKTQWESVFAITRARLGNPNTHNKKTYSDKPYRIIAKSQKVLANYPNKEAIIKKSSLSAFETEELLGYKLKTNKG